MARLRRFSGTPVAEGVRLEVGKYTVFAVRNEKKDIAMRMRREPRGLLRALMRIPFLRGVTRLFRDLIRFFDGLSESAELKPQRPVRGTEPEQKLARLLNVAPQSLATLASAILLVFLGFLCLYAAPKGAEAMLLSTAATRAQTNAAVAFVRILGLLCAVFLGCRLRVIKRLLMYKGAINQCINCYECRDEVTNENATQYPIIARRSESAFLLCVVIVSMIFFSMIHTDSALVSLASRIGILLGVSAVLNEPFAALESAHMSGLVRLVRAPMDALQYMTTLEPHPQMTEVAVCAFRAALEDGAQETEDSESGEGEDEA